MSSARPPRLLVCGGPAFESAAIGGIQHVLADLVEGLRGCGWQVDTIFDGAGDDSSSPPPVFRPAPWQFRLGLVGAALRLPEAWRLPVGVLLYGPTRLRALSAVLSRIDAAIRSGDYAAVIACVDVRSPIGLGAMAAASHPGAILISLEQIARELRHSTAIRAGRAAARLVTAGNSHPYLYSAVRPASAAAVVFASEAWRDEAVAAGLPVERARVIPFGVPVPDALPDRVAAGTPARLLWAARLSARKGLDLFLPAVALLRRERAVRLTLVAAPEAGPYPSHVARLIDRLGLADIVDQRPAVDRRELPSVFASHDALLFHSVFREPVAQMLLLAFAHGLPVIGPASPDPRSLLQDGDTAFCFADRSAAAVAAAIGRALGDEEARAAVRRRAFARVVSGHALGDTISAYDVLIREIVDLRVRAAHS